MMVRGRNPYVNRYQSENPPVSPQKTNTDTDDIRATIVETLKTLSSGIDEVKKSIKRMEEKFDYLEERQRKVEDQVNRYISRNMSIDPELTTIKSELEALRRDQRPVNPAPSISPYSNNMSVMPGTGFASVTPEYLRSLGRK